MKEATRKKLDAATAAVLALGHKLVTEPWKGKEGTEEIAFKYLGGLPKGTAKWVAITTTHDLVVVEISGDAVQVLIYPVAQAQTLKQVVGPPEKTKGKKTDES